MKKVMLTTKIDKVKFLLDNLLSGKIKRGENLAAFCEKYQVSERTFDTYWVKAQKEFVAIKENDIKKAAAKSSRDEVKAAEAIILTKLQRLEIASKIANSDTEKSNDRIKAMEYISKIEGEFITKVAQTDSEGNDVGFEISSAIELMKVVKGKK
jgi:hypothetical protein